MLLLMLLFMGMTLLTYFLVGTIPDEPTTLKEKLLRLFDLRSETNFAVWYSSLLFFSVFLSLLLLGWGKNQNYQPSLIQRAWLQLAALGCLALSADETASIHEKVGRQIDSGLQLLEGTPVYNMGYPWLLAAPILLLVFFFFARQLYKLIQTLPKQRTARVALMVALVALPMVFVLEFIELWFGYHGQKSTIFPVFEEYAELIGMYALLWCHCEIAEQHAL